MPDSVISTGSDAFNDCSSLNYIYLSNALEDIGAGSFCECLSLKKIEIPNSVKRIRSFAFNTPFGEDFLIFYKGTKEQWNNIDIYDSNSWVTLAKIFYGVGYHECSDYAVIDNAVSATCTTDGLTEGKHCSLCGYKIVEQEVIEALGHDLEYHGDIEATYENNGATAYYSCKRCGKCFSDYNANKEIIKDSWVIPKLTPTTKPTEQPTPVPTPTITKDRKTTFSIKNKAKIKNTTKIKVKDKDKIKKITLNGKTIKIKKNKTSITIKLKSYKKALKKKGKWNTLKVTDNKGNLKSIKFKTK